MRTRLSLCGAVLFGSLVAGLIVYARRPPESPGLPGTLEARAQARAQAAPPARGQPSPPETAKPAEKKPAPEKNKVAEKKPAPEKGQVVEKKPAPPEVRERFVFPNDSAGKLLERELTPSDKLPAAPEGDRPGQRPWPVPPALGRLESPLPPAQVDVPKVPLASLPPARPRSLPEELPLVRSEGDLAFRPLLPAGPRLRVPSPDVGQLPPLPQLAQAQPDRVPLEDPTLDASVAAALAAQTPQRTTPAPFLRVNLPDPFEYSAAVRLRSPPPEGDPPAGAARLPGR